MRKKDRQKEKLYAEKFYDLYIKSYTKKEFKELSESQQDVIKKIPAFWVFVAKEDEETSKIIKEFPE